MYSVLITVDQSFTGPCYLLLPLYTLLGSLICDHTLGGIPSTKSSKGCPQSGLFNKKGAPLFTTVGRCLDFSDLIFETSHLMQPQSYSILLLFFLCRFSKWGRFKGLRQGEFLPWRSWKRYVDGSWMLFLLPRIAHFSFFSLSLSSLYQAPLPLFVSCRQR